MSGFKRYTDVLHLFDEVRSDWTIPGIAAALDVPASTVYRTVRALLADNFLEPAREGHYRLGSAFVAFDRLVRLTDPIARLGDELLRDIVLQARVPCAGVLARLYGDTVMCVADAVPAGDVIRTSYERGRPRPLTRGATSKVILAQLPTRRLNKLLNAHAGQERHPHAPGLAQLRDELALIRKRGYCVTRGEVDKGLVGIAAPVSVPDRALTASLSLVVPASLIDEAVERRLVLLVVSASALLTNELTHIEQPTVETRGKAAP